MALHLIVRHPFGDYARGDRISDPDEVARVAQECGEHVTRVTAPDTAPAEAAPPS